MALRVKSIDEETIELADIYDELAKKKLYRNHNNKVYLILRAYAAGKIGLTDAALALHNRFDPLHCDDLDLYSAAKLVGTDFKHGAGSILCITVINEDKEKKILEAGTYNYLSAGGMTFSFEVAVDIEFEPQEGRIIMAISHEKGSFPVGDNESIKLFRSDSEPIDKAFAFSCEDNSGMLGYEDETPFDFRTRILNDADRQDHVRELELRIRNLPNIFECNLIINDTILPQIYDGLNLAPKELLVTITGVPTDEVAKTVCETVLYDTHQVDPELVVWYNNPLYINGRRPVYYRFHSTTDFSLTIEYQYDIDKLTTSQIEGAIDKLFKPYTRMVTHQDVFTEADAYTVLEALNLPNVKILNVDIYDSNGAPVSYVNIPKTRLAHLTGITFTSIAIDRTLP